VFWQQNIAMIQGIIPDLSGQPKHFVELATLVKGPKLSKTANTLVIDKDLGHGALVGGINQPLAFIVVIGHVVGCVGYAFAVQQALCHTAKGAITG
jgi:hypothetical protein